MPNTMHSDVLNNIENEIPRLRRYARYLARDADKADDLVQDALVSAVTKIDQWQPNTNLRAWLMTILRNAFLNGYRRSKRERLAMQDIASQNIDFVPAQQEVQLVLNEVDQAFHKLSEIHQEVILLVAIEGLPYEEAADITNVSVGTIKSRLSRARACLRDLVEEPDIISQRSKLQRSNGHG
ncbi:MAG: RNA polymerase sigma factor [Hyphomicrobiaceae bacterium]